MLGPSSDVFTPTNTTTTGLDGTFEPPGAIYGNILGRSSDLCPLTKAATTLDGVTILLERYMATYWVVSFGAQTRFPKQFL